ncbi:MAG: Tar ligand binding domain-containing protein, partial [Rhodospirillales bacterium]|nr:Tar ligand binding domain-containing protein [Rhodospirillales bacterium]
MQFLRRMKIGAKIYSIVGLLSLVAAVIGALGLEGMMTYNARVDEIALASQRAVIGEQVNGLINAVVMDSRGVYMARDVAEAEKFGAPLLKNLKTIEERMTRWLSLMPAERKTTTDRAMENVRKFVEFRAELVRRG